MYGPILEGKLVRLRPPQPADAAVMITWFDDLEVTRFLKLQNPPSLDAEKEWLDRMARDPDSVFWVVEHVGRVVGGTSIVRIDWKHGFGTTGTMLGDKSVWGKGLGEGADAAPGRLCVHADAAAQAQVRVPGRQRGERPSAARGRLQGCRPLDA